MTKTEETAGYPRYNMYLCRDCGTGYVSRDLEPGVTPFMTVCDRCGGSAESFMYKIPQEILERSAAYMEWRKPTEEEYKACSDGAQTHVDMGGLLRFNVPFTPKPPPQKRPFKTANGVTRMFRP